eukprot:Platyproteum_vivax@DN6955_c0_g1_i2.p1
MLAKRYELINKKGEGTFANVYKGKSTTTGRYVAVKVLKDAKFEDTIEDIREVRVLKQFLNNPHIVQLYETVYNPVTCRLSLVFELMDMNLLESICGRSVPFSEDRVRRVIYQVLLALKALHKNMIMHRDIKPENILLKNSVVKLSDFGSSSFIEYKECPLNNGGFCLECLKHDRKTQAVVEDRGVYRQCTTSKNESEMKPRGRSILVKARRALVTMTDYIATRWYRAPEVLLTNGFYSIESDIWAVGCVMFELLTLKVLFPGGSETEMTQLILEVLGTPSFKDVDELFCYQGQKRLVARESFCYPNEPGVGIDCQLPPEISHDCRDLLSKMLRFSPLQRISAEDALRHPFFDPVRANKLPGLKGACTMGAKSTGRFTVKNAPAAVKPFKKPLHLVVKPVKHPHLAPHRVVPLTEVTKRQAEDMSSGGRSASAPRTPRRPRPEPLRHTSTKPKLAQSLPPQYLKSIKCKHQDLVVVCTKLGSK